ncbi:hypothetical protein ACFSO7_13635 [Bacillus sp. CGMCC 1.16607]|uniref:AlkZ-related protein n=1 Tax=Bacillus sp. CGMCC 1.16607 TaxID=3351842 RepID=UPI00363F5E66
MVDLKIKTYDEAIKVIEEFGLLPLSPLIPNYPSLNSITSQESWHSDTENDPWIWRTKFSVDGVAGYGKFIKKKSVFISRELLPYVKTVLGSVQPLEERYFNGNVSKEAYDIYKIIREEEGIDTRLLRAKAGLKHKDQKKSFENGLLELQGSMDIVISDIQLKTDEFGEKNGWSSTAFETYDSWANRKNIESINMEKGQAKQHLMDHFSSLCSEETLKKLGKIFL